MVGLDNRWTPGIGDPTVMGWVTVAMYVLVAMCCFLVREIDPDDGSDTSLNQFTSYRKFWWVLAAFLILMGLNKQLDLQSLFTQLGRDFAKSAGWYENRRLVQTTFIIAIGVLGCAVGGYLVYRFRHACQTIKIALSGFILLLAFVVMRAASFHNFDRLIGYELGGIRFNWIMEIGALLIVATATLRYRRNYL